MIFVFLLLLIKILPEILPLFDNNDFVFKKCILTWTAVMCTVQVSNWFGLKFFLLDMIVVFLHVAVDGRSYFIFFPESEARKKTGLIFHFWTWKWCFCLTWVFSHDYLVMQRQDEFVRREQSIKLIWCPTSLGCLVFSLLSLPFLFPH